MMESPYSLFRAVSTFVIISGFDLGFQVSLALPVCNDFDCRGRRLQSEEATMTATFDETLTNTSDAASYESIFDHVSEGGETMLTHLSELVGLNETTVMDKTAIETLFTGLGALGASEDEHGHEEDTHEHEHGHEEDAHEEHSHDTEEHDHEHEHEDDHEHEDEHGHEHEHDHEHEHEHEEHTYLLTSDEYYLRYGNMDLKFLPETCLSLLACQVDKHCVLMLGNGSNAGELLGEEEHDHGEDGAEPPISLGTLKLIIIAVFFVEAWLGIMLPVLLRNSFRNLEVWIMSLLNCFSGGLFLAFGLMHMLPDVMGAQEELGVEYPLAGFMAVMGFMLVFFIEHILTSQHSHHSHAHPTKSLEDEDSEPLKDDNLYYESSQDLGHATTAPAIKPMRLSSAMIMLVAVAVHTILETIVLGLSDTYTDVMLLFIAIGGHKWATAMAVSVRFLQTGMPFKKTLVFLVPFSLVAPTGVMIGMLVNGTSAWAEIILAGLSAGTMIYIGSIEVMAEEFHTDVENGPNKWWKFLLVIVGIAVVAALALVGGGHHHH